MTETEIKKQITDYLTIRKIPYFRVHNNPSLKRKGTVTVGAPDLVFVYKGLTVCCEIKTPEGKQSPAQIDLEYKIEMNGGCYRILRSLDDLIKLLS